MADCVITGLGQIAINVHDLSRAKHFYGQLLGLPHLFDAGPALAFFQCGDVRLMLSIPETREFDHPASILYYRVTDIHASYRDLAAKGVHFEDAPHLIAPLPEYDLWMAFARDTEGNLLGLMAEMMKG
ncbi:MAG TPA: VOC family protein [Steroidobacteraceae bacterium]|jgi:methylmalonyl-CoA/ethylmalonyl-CoA epimerase